MSTTLDIEVRLKDNARPAMALFGAVARLRGSQPVPDRIASVGKCESKLPTITVAPARRGST